MVTQHGIKFAVHLITKHFGKIVAKVCENLFIHGPLTLDQLVRYTDLTKDQVRNSLLVLVQHNCVQAFVSAPQDDDDDADRLRVRTQYLVLFDSILHRLRFPKFLEIVSRKLDEECVKLLDGLLRDGRLTLKQMVDRESQRKGKCLMIHVIENAVPTKVVRETLCKLLTARFVERCPAPEPVVSTSFKETTTRKRGAKSAKIFEAPETLEQRVVDAAVPGDVIRFSLAADTRCSVDRETNSDDAQMISVEEEVAKEGQILWRANFEEFIRHLRHKVLIENVRTQHDDGTATVLSAVLEATRSVQKKVKTENSVPLSLDTIITEVMKTDTGRTMTVDRIRASLVQLGCSPSMILEESYSIDLKKIIEPARNEEVESIVLKRYGTDGYRIFRLLAKDCCFHDTDQIAASTLVEKKEASKLLYKLWKDNYLYMEKVGATVGAKQTTILMWKVNKPLLWEYVLDEMYHAALNLSLRMAFEQEKDEELLKVPKDKRQGPGPLQKKYKKLLNVWLLLGSSLMKLDDALMLFHDF
ncbi:DNA-directed RNA polymerase III subunit RPC3 [Glycine max]|uniref:DNA-directed RNA polymerase III subunit RPC3 n=1 Tax=Glycine soja TaxID=3848 RepID=A0A0B2QNM4_GLYSO|nr:DNA-directed RNA polymerase III subunit RPC3 [Glycine max]KHN21749.1 DNA-directed RNA polymerase III subunit RPC3 [Glycine soja]